MRALSLPTSAHHFFPTYKDLVSGLQHVGGGEPNAAEYGDCVVCVRSYKQINETAVLTYLKSTSRSNESFDARQLTRDAYLADMEVGTVLLVPPGVS